MEITKNKLYHGDCLDIMPYIKDKSIDMVLADVPYGTTACKWDVTIPFEPMWKELKRIVKNNSAICLFGSEPFSSRLRLSNLKNYKYDWIWEKNRGSNFALTKHQPMKEHEIISVFSYGTHRYYPIKEKRKGKGLERIKGKYSVGKTSSITGITKTICTTQGQELRQPSSIQKFNTTEKGIKRVHPTQKPVALIQYLIKTYTNKGDVILDFTIGSGTTAIACINESRNWIGIEKDEEYYNLADKRIKDKLWGLF